MNNNIVEFVEGEKEVLEGLGKKLGVGYERAEDVECMCGKCLGIWSGDKLLLRKTLVPDELLDNKMENVGWLYLMLYG